VPAEQPRRPRCPLRIRRRLPQLRQKLPPVSLSTRKCRTVCVMAEPATQADWQGWIERHGPKLLLFARQKARGEAEAQDLVQDAVLECWQRCNHGLPDLPMVFATIQRRAIDHARREDRRASRERMAGPDLSQPWFDTGVEDREMSHLVQSALAQLPAEQRDVVVLKTWGRLTFAEIAAAQDIPANTAASRYRYGLAALRGLMQHVLR